MKAGTGAGGQHVGGAAAGGDKNGAGNNNRAGGEDGGGSGGGGGGGTDAGTDASAGNAATSHEPPNRQRANNGSGDETQYQQQQQSQTAAAQKPPLPPTMTSAAKGGGGEQQTHQQDETKEKKLQVGSDSGDPDDPEEDEILEESPCKRWSKRREKVKQRDVPGIDAAYLAMDNETGNEVVWNEVLFSERKNFREQEEKIRAVFDHLTRLEHPYLVKFHKYWLDTKSEKPRIIFITEYMSSGPMSRFLQKARSSGTLLNIKAWKNWIRQILSALSYLHSCDPPIVHGNLTCNTMFIQHNGLVKIGCVAPNTIHHHVKTYRENIKNIHYLAPEYDHLTEITTQADIYSFGVCALEMATTGALQSGSLNGASAGASTAGPSEKASSAPPAIESGGSTTTAQTSVAGGSHIVTEELLRKAVDSLEDPEQKEFINRCLEKDPNIRANAVELLSRLGPAEPEKDEISLDEEAFMDEIRQQTHEPTPTPGMAADRATSPPQQQEAAPNIEAAATSSNTSTIHQHHQAPQQQHNQAAAALLNQNTQQQPLPQTVTATTAAQQDGYHTQCTVTTTIATHASAAATTTTTAIAHPQTSSTHLPSTPQQQNSQQQNNSQQQQQQMQHLHQTAPDEGYHTTQSIVDAPTGTSTPLSAEMSILPTSGMPAQHRETRQILQMQAEMLDSRQLRVQLQLDDQMNRQLTALLRDEDTPEALVAELVQHGFVSEANSPKMRELLATVLSEHRRRELEQAARREFGDSGQHRQSAAASSTASSNHSSAHQSPKHQSVPPPQTSSTS